MATVPRLPLACAAVDGWRDTPLEWVGTCIMGGCGPPLYLGLLPSGEPAVLLRSRMWLWGRAGGGPPPFTHGRVPHDALTVLRHRPALRDWAPIGKANLTEQDSFAQSAVQGDEFLLAVGPSHAAAIYYGTDRWALRRSPVRECPPTSPP